MWVDSHCHLQLMELSSGVSSVLAAARDAGVEKMLCVSVALDDIDTLSTLEAEHEMVSISLGLHPNHAIQSEPDAEQLIQLGQKYNLVAIGETGLDYYRPDILPAVQQERFRAHVRAAKVLKKPLIIHSRSAKQDTLRILKEEGADEVGGVFHCFTEDWDMAKRGIAMNFLISFSGIVTFRNADDVRSVAEQVPLDALLVETDAPYLAPVPYRGKPNTPAFVVHTGECLADLRKVPVEQIATSTTQNYNALFA